MKRHLTALLLVLGAACTPVCADEPSSPATSLREASLPSDSCHPSQALTLDQLEASSPFDFSDGCVDCAPYDENCVYSQDGACCDGGLPCDIDGACCEGGWPCDCNELWDECCCFCCRTGVIMPECPVLFKPFMADPRQVCYSVGWRFDDRVFTQHIIDVSYGDFFPIYRIWNMFLCGDALEFDLEGALWAIFEPLHYSAPLVNADYYVGLPITYAYGPWSFRFRFFHISSHIGDEFLLNHPRFRRLNPSAEYVDLAASYQLNCDLRVYFLVGRIVSRDRSFPFKRNYVEWGVENYFRHGSFYLEHDCLSIEPFFAMHFRCREDNHWREDSTYVLGYEFHKHSGLCRKMRLFLEYHQGYSLEGQFSRCKTTYLSIRATYGF